MKMETRSTLRQHSILRKRLSDFNHLTSYQNCCGRVGLKFAWLFDRKKTPNAFITGEKPPLDFIQGSLSSYLNVDCASHTDSCYHQPLYPAIEDPSANLGRGNGSFQPLAKR